MYLIFILGMFGEAFNSGWYCIRFKTMNSGTLVCLLAYSILLHGKESRFRAGLFRWVGIRIIKVVVASVLLNM